jgi:hypothetical protein
VEYKHRACIWPIIGLETRGSFPVESPVNKRRAHAQKGLIPLFKVAYRSLMSFCCSIFFQSRNEVIKLCGIRRIRFLRTSGRYNSVFLKHPKGKFTLLVIARNSISAKKMYLCHWTINNFFFKSQYIAI